MREDIGLDDSLELGEEGVHHPRIRMGIMRCEVGGDDDGEIEAKDIGVSAAPTGRTAACPA